MHVDLYNKWKCKIGIVSYSFKSINIKMNFSPLSLVAIPCSIVCTIADSASDYENWKKTRHMRAKGLPDKFLPLKVKYDWAEFDARIKSNNKTEFTGVSK